MKKIIALFFMVLFQASTVSADSLNEIRRMVIGNKDAKIRTKPSDKTLRFVLGYAKSVNVIKSRLIEPFVIPFI